MKTRVGYSRLQIGLHWLIAVLVILAWFTGEGMGDALRQRLASGATGFEGNTLHVWLGGTIFALVVIRLIVRFAAGAPEPDNAITGLHRTAAIWGHRALYLLMVLVPALGASTWYLGMRDMGDVHETLGNLFLLVVLGHAVVAIFHHFRGGHTLHRMFKPQS